MEHLKFLKNVRVNADHDVNDKLVGIVGIVECYIVAVGKGLKVMNLYVLIQLLDAVLKLAVLSLMMYLKGIGK